MYGDGCRVAGIWFLRPMPPPPNAAQAHEPRAEEEQTGGRERRDTGDPGDLRLSLHGKAGRRRKNGDRT